MGIDKHRVRVVVADDRPLIRTQLHALLDAEPDLDIVGLGWSGIEALRLVHKLEPDVLVVDEEMNDIRGTEVAAHLGVAGIKIRVVLYTISDWLREEGMADGSNTAHCVLDEESVGALMTAIRRPPAGLAARAN